MSTDKNTVPVVITIKPTCITTTSTDPSRSDSWHSRYVRPVAMTAFMAGITWAASIAVSLIDTSASPWIGIAGMLATGMMLYRMLFRYGLVLNRIVGSAIVLVTIPLPIIFSNAPFLHVSPTFLAAISGGMAIGWIGHVLGLLKKGGVPCTTAV